MSRTLLYRRKSWIGFGLGSTSLWLMWQSKVMQKPSMPRVLLWCLLLWLLALAIPVTVEKIHEPANSHRLPNETPGYRKCTIHAALDVNEVAVMAHEEGITSFVTWLLGVLVIVYPVMKRMKRFDHVSVLVCSKEMARIDLSFDVSINGSMYVVRCEEVNLVRLGSFSALDSMKEKEYDNASQYPDSANSNLH
ncbi:hypothetical protein RIF29_25079 [Crotalaria pallida]|uniref:Uncharacterized protein n=1 Tax=Crotalaria pallida TaxID=3830 RepID=A0AAN9ENC4_CROPI